MRNAYYTDSIPTRVVNNKVLIGVEDTFEGFTTPGGISLVNLTENDSWGDSHQYNISEFVMRNGKVIYVPDFITKGSFNYETECELQPGDECFWNLISFQDHIPIIIGNKLMLLVDYHEIHARIRNGVITGINGFGLFTPTVEIKSALKYTTKEQVSDIWVLEKIPEKRIQYDENSRQESDCWKEGDKVYLLVKRSPFRLQGNIRRSLEKDYFACPMNYVICTA